MNRIKLSLASFVVASLIACVSCNDKSGAQSSTSADSVKSVATAAAASNIDYNGKIVYVQIDSVMRGYGMAIDLQAEFNTKSQKAQTELNNKARSLENEMRDYNEKAQKGLVTRFQANDIEAGLQTKQQSLMQYRDQKMQELTEEEAVMMNKISNSILEFVKAYNVEQKYSMIISTNGANTVLTADPSLDITAALLAGLNDKYRKEQPAVTPAKK